jgi:hypothetical protein
VGELFGHDGAGFAGHYSLLTLREISVMVRSFRAIATLASIAVLACSIFAVGWVSLALLGY